MPPSPTFTEAAKAAEAQFLADLKAAGVNSVSMLEAFAAEWAPQIAEWSISFATAVIDGNKAQADRYANDLADLAALAAAKAAEAGISIQATAEQDAAATMQSLMRIAGKAAVGALLAV